ncbi:phenylalanyl-tRNA synthetase, alpha subunit [Candidatus Thermokryptus mobilis]|uniref:Phenylalanine--tRNA ligase alpha subunit n=1 Tax=Candidatus Thermokryptus mobilis TaxID=1643428 RepID=A0A0S4NCJ3_9BACT|nr:phenylalanine--tRNA ligase subunit alpha [Candidatus Thermokryptus mobilis]CUU08629.1 phenylalanyl-tRNA synthetase, alpha subunit [Candidatus Thermokryptus mobilis]
MKNQIEEVKSKFLSEISSVEDEKQLEELRVKYLGRRGIIQSLFDKLREVPKEEKPALGKLLNELKELAQGKYNEKKLEIKGKKAKVESFVDLTIPGRLKYTGRKHPLTQTLEEIKKIFIGMGFEVASGPEIEDDYHNFEALNIPPEHPARDMQDTFFIEDKIILRTHTSPVQIRVMESKKPPVRIIAPGRVYRNEAISARSYCLFHQVEGLYVDEGVSFAELKGTLLAFAKQMFGSDVKLRFRPSFFPFTEPSAEVDVSCFICGGKGCRVCKYGGWLEILGCGMVDPNVFKFVGYDAEKYTGYAFGMGVERIAMLKYGIDDIRLFYENDFRFLDQF